MTKPKRCTDNQQERLLAAVSEIEQLQQDASQACTAVARLLVGRLRRVEPAYVLQAFKRELRGFNIATGKWKEETSD